MIGLEKNKVRLDNYSIEWTTFYEKEKKEILCVIGDLIKDIEHIGATAVPGIKAKPIIDILIGVENFAETGTPAMRIIGLLVGLGYYFRGNDGLPGRLLFIRQEDNLSLYHIHVVESNSKLWYNHIRFRDILRGHSDVAKQYEDLKIKLALKFPEDRNSYTWAKTDFIEKVLANYK
jgi:GrpB-like predicted nucleotidyltransferase (UPF0157 family)